MLADWYWGAINIIYDLLDVRRRIELIQDFEMPAVSTNIKVSRDGQYIIATGKLNDFKNMNYYCIFVSFLFFNVFCQPGFQKNE